MKRRDYKMILAVEVLLLTILTSCHRLCKEEAIGEVACAAAIQVEEDTMQIDVAADMADVRRPDVKIHVRRGQTLAMQTKGLTLTAIDAAVQHEADYSATALVNEELPPLPQGMVNMTDAAAGYRLLPGGEHFSPYAELRITYDPERLPEGYTPEDIYTSYYDTATCAWVRLQRIDVDTIHHEIVSLTTHFTDFINELLKAPEMPETQAFVPTVMSDLEAVSPMDGLPMVQPPTANNNGTANVSYPIVIPAGRNGMQPNLSLNYSSSGGSGWLGVGWDIPVSSITLDTRWGVPRYDARYETEIYLLNGEQLVAESNGELLPMPHRTNQQVGRLSDGTRYHARTGDAHDSIIRHGNTPKNYWWEVVDRNGITSYYGRYADSSRSALPATLCNDNGDIAKWVLTETRDLYGNCVRYYYDLATQNVNGNIGRQIYLDSIAYTGYGGNDGFYNVVFCRIENKTHDVQISCNLGFKEVSSQLLNHIYVKAGDDILTAWQFETENNESSNYKNRLVSVTKIDSAEGGMRPFLSQLCDCIQADEDDADSNLADNGDGFGEGDAAGHWEEIEICDTLTRTVSWDKLVYEYPISVTRWMETNPEIKTEYDTLLAQFGDDRNLFTNEYDQFIQMHWADYSKWVDSVMESILQPEEYEICYPQPIWVYNNIESSENHELEVARIEDLDNYVGTTTFFDYYDAPAIENMFGDPVESTDLGISGAKGNLATPNLLPGGITNNPTALGLSASSSWSIGGTAAAGGGPVVCLTSLSLGGNYTRSQSSSESLMTLVDLDGDGLADKVYVKNGKMYFCRRIFNDDTIRYESPVLINGISHFLEESSFSNTFGGQLALVGVSGSASWTNSESTTSTYFADVNGDGLVDLVDNGQVWFNRLDSNHNPNFTIYQPVYSTAGGSDPTLNPVVVNPSDCGGIILDGEVNDSIVCEYRWMVDTVLVFKDTDDAHEFDRHYFDVEDTIVELDCHNYESEVEYVSSILDNDDWWKCHYGENGDDVRDEMSSWYKSLSDSMPTNRCEAVVKVRKLDCTYHDESQNTEAVRVWIAPRAGSITINSHVGLIQDQSSSRQYARHADGVLFSVQHSSKVIPSSRSFLPFSQDTILFSLRIADSDYDGHEIMVGDHINVKKGDMIFFRLRSLSSHHFDNVTDYHQIIYEDEPGHEYNSMSDFVLTGYQVFQAPVDGSYRISGDYTDSSHNTSMAIWLTPGTGGPTYINPDSSFTVSGTILRNQSIIMQIRNTTTNPINWGEVECYPHIVFFPDTTSRRLDSVDGGAVVSQITEPIEGWFPVQMVIPEHPGILMGQNNLYHRLFGPLHNGWGQFAYHAIDHGSKADFIRVEKLIPTDMMVNGNTNTSDQQQMDDMVNNNNTSSDVFENSSSLEDFERNADTYNPLSYESYWVEMTPDVEHNAWVSYGRQNHVSRMGMSNDMQTEWYHEVPANNSNIDQANLPDMTTYDDPVPAPVNGNPARAVRKVNRSENHSWSVGAFGAGVSGSKGTNEIVTDYMDLNGDRYPDIIGPVCVQYSNPWGGLSDHVTSLNVNTDDISDETWSAGISFGASPITIDRTISGSMGNAKFSMNCKGSGGIGGQGNLGQNKARGTWVDMNGDGLADYVHEDGYVSLNLGHEFASKEKWNAFGPRQGVSASVGAGVNVNLFQGSIEVGAGINSSYNQNIRMLMDINGDGLPDLVYRNVEGISGAIACSDSIETKVRFNMGNGQWSDAQTLGFHQFNSSTSYSESVNAGFTAGFTVFGAFKVTVGLNGTPYSGSINRDYVQLVDVDADGLPDLVSSDDEGTMEVRYNKGANTNCLKTITNFTGSSIQLEYTLSKPTYDQPSRCWLMTRMTTIDSSNLNGGEKTVTEFEYESPHYDRYERTSYGYAVVKTKHVNHADNSIYRIIERDYNNKDILRQGKLTRELTSDGNGNRYIEKIMESTYVDYTDGHIVGDTSCPGMAYPAIVANLVRYYEGDSTSQLTVAESYEYDRYHNIVRYTDMGDTSNADDGVVVHFNYLHGLRHNLIGLRSEYTIASLADTNTILRHATFAYDTAKGRLTQQNLWNGNTPSQFDFEYDAYGNLTIGIQPQNDNGERVRFNYQYDSVVHSYPIRIVNHFGEEMFTQYDYRFGKPIRVTDPSGNSMDYSYDFAGRLTSVTSPLNSSGVPSLTNQYHPVNYYHGIHPNGYTYSPSPSGHSYTITRHNDDQGRTITETVVISDASGRAIQTKKGITENGVPKMQVSGRSFTDAFGRVIRRYDPVVETLETHRGTFNPNYSASSEVFTSYDVMDRPLVSTQPLGVTTQNSYSIRRSVHNVNCFVTKTINPNGDSVFTYKDYNGSQVMVIDALGHATVMHYDNLGQLDSTSDPEGFTTYYSYDNLGRLVFRNHPDAGLTQYGYDPAGNIVQETNPLGQINYDYTYYRLLYKRYNYMTGNDVAYTYGTSGNETGRPVRIEDGSGTYECQYDALGNVVDEIRTIAIPHHGNVYQFRMRYQYDSWGRMLGMTYPDGERIGYTYHWGGDLYAMHGDKNGDTRAYIKGTFYNIYGQKSLVEYGNQTKTSYTYDALHRLSRLQSWDANSALMQDIDYTFDDASNVTGIRNRAGVVNTLGGTYENAYKYDELHRLINSRGNGAIGNYNIDLSYSPSGRLMTKFRDNSSVTLSATADMAYGYCDDYQPHAVKRMFDYNNGMLYDMRWDRAGNLGQVSIADHTHQFESGRFLFWTEDSRMHTVVDDRYYSYYAYDYSGERRLKLTGENSLLDINADVMSTYSILNEPTLYPSAYMVLTNKGYTKHYYAGAERVAARLGGGGLDAMGQTIGNEDALQEKSTLLFDQSLEQACGRVMDRNNIECIMGNASAHEEFGHIIDGIPNMIKAEVKHDCRRFTDMVATMSVDRGQGREPEVFFYHSDHLGSASWITDHAGDAVQHLQYLPYGEPYINQRLSGYNERFTFTGKERDAETGYGYFGARYMDHELMTMWLSIDPMADKYPGISPYAYCAWNPVKLVDPDGKEIWKPEITSCGEVSYVAENGDSKLTFQKQYNVSKSATDKIFSESGISNVKQGDRISGEKIASIVTNNTGRKYNDVLKINWNNASKKQIAYHTMFAILCNHIRGGETIDMNQFICGMPSETGDPANLNLRDVDIPLPDGKTMLLQAFNSSFNSKYSKLSPQPLGQFDRADGSSSSNHEYDQPTKLGGSGIQRLLVSFSGKYNDAYTNAYYQ